MEDRFIRHSSCPECDSNNNVGVYETTEGKQYLWCFSCQKRVGTSMTSTTTSSPFVSNKEDLLGLYQSCPIRPLLDRGIHLSTCERYQVKTVLSTTDGISPEKYLFPYYKGNKLEAYKVATVAEKSFHSVGKASGNDLFGLNLLSQGGKYLFITEGELDALSLYQALKETSGAFEPQVVSIGQGAAAALKNVSHNMEVVESYEHVILCFDQDEPGQQAAAEVAKLLSGKSKIAKFPLKDANEMLMAGKTTELRQAVFSARDYQPDSLLNGADLWDRYIEDSKEECYYYPETWAELNDRTCGYRLGSIVTLTSGSGSGKTQLMREIKYNMLRTTDWKIGDISLEEDISESQRGLVSLAMNKRLHLPDVHVPVEDERSVFNDLFATRRMMFYDHFGGMEDDRLFSTIRYLGSKGYKAIFLDHLSIIVSEFASEGSERERIDTIMTKLAKLAKEFKLVIFLVVHLRKSGNFGPSFENGAVPTLDDLRGSSTLKQLSWDVFSLSRNQQHSDIYCSNTSLVTVLKCRFTGGVGPADYLNFNSNTGRMVKVPEPMGYNL